MDTDNNTQEKQRMPRSKKDIQDDFGVLTTSGYLPILDPTVTIHAINTTSDPQVHTIAVGNLIEEYKKAHPEVEVLNLNEEISKLEKKYKMSSRNFLKKFAGDEDAESFDFRRWKALLAAR